MKRVIVPGGKHCIGWAGWAHISRRQYTPTEIRQTDTQLVDAYVQNTIVHVQVPTYIPTYVPTEVFMYACMCAHMDECECKGSESLGLEGPDRGP